MNRNQNPQLRWENAYQTQIRETLSRQTTRAAHHPNQTNAVSAHRDSVCFPPKTDPAVCRLPPYRVPPLQPMIADTEENVNNLL